MEVASMAKNNNKNLKHILTVKGSALGNVGSTIKVSPNTHLIIGDPGIYLDFPEINQQNTPPMVTFPEGSESLSSKYREAGVSKIVINKTAKCVVVKFYDHAEEVVHCDEDDEFDPRIGIALALAYHLFGSKNKFKDFIKKKSKYLK